ncbi:branched-chain amino acid ABC transporter permease [Geodermatophilus sabuli]|uniref:Branched-chain amino acid ABC transporter permease n=1 Tax=Geodermatophilus sabuli TaxID=1564158 RepID=A0A7K3W3F0_9ACTN|nr:branched-chain amino acid ABC transporter permease [Geodermatophilus sabuli]NEK58457.1 branched-chain amino acid ABC transporter permease [Geodermatophilus sabuli]
MLQSILSGLEAGSWFSLLGLAIVVVMKAADVPNFAMAEIGLVATYVGTSLAAAGANFWVAVVVTLLAGVVVAVLIDVGLMRRLAGHGHFPLLLMTIGLSLALNALIGRIWGQEARRFDAPWSGSFVSIGGVEVSVAQIVTIVLGAAGAIAITSFFRTSLGAQMRAVAENRATARLIGVRVGRVSAMAWALGGAIATLAVMLQAQSTLVSTHSASSLIVYGFVAATMGGFVSLIGTFFGGLALGLIQSLAGLYISTSIEFAVALLAVVLVLLARPSGFTAGLRLRDV